MQTVLLVFAIGFIFGAIGAYIAEKKGRSHYEGFFFRIFIWSFRCYSRNIFAEKAKRKLNYFTIFFNVKP